VETGSLVPLFKRWWRGLLAAALVAGVAGYFIASNASPTYEAQVQMIVGPINTDFETIEAAGTLSRGYAELARSRPVVARAIERSGARTTPQRLLDDEAVTTTSNDITRIIAITVRYSDARTTAALANALAKRVQELAARASKRVETASENLMSQPEIRALDLSVQDRIGEAVSRVLNPSVGGLVSVIEPAVVPDGPIAPRVSLITLLAAFMGLLIMSVVVLLRESSTPDLADEQALVALPETTFLGTLAASVPRRDGAELITDAALPDVASGHRAVATKLGFFGDRSRIRSLLLVDTEDGERSSAVAATLAATLGDAGRRVLLLDAGTGPQGLTSALELEGTPGYSDLLTDSDGGGRNGDAGELALSLGENVTILPSGNDEETGVLESERAKRLLKRLGGRYNNLIIAAAPMHRSPSALIWGAAADGTVLVVDDNRTTEEELAEALRNLRFVGASVLGTVVGRVPRARRGFAIPRNLE
jgi:capsular polysaccharide biosynthesis protein/Mrp family chromosome partitioning ATPase